jgi:hypothetical protein
VVVAIMFAVVALRFMGGQFYACNDPGVQSTLYSMTPADLI